MRLFVNSSSSFGGSCLTSISLLELFHTGEKLTTGMFQIRSLGEDRTGLWKPVCDLDKQLGWSELLRFLVDSEVVADQTVLALVLRRKWYVISG